jgi:hypothetical protein
MKQGRVNVKYNCANPSSGAQLSNCLHGTLAIYVKYYLSHDDRGKGEILKSMLMTFVIPQGTFQNHQLLDFLLS